MFLGGLEEFLGNLFVGWREGSSSYHSYTLPSSSGLMVQFRSETSRLDITTTELAKKVLGRLAPGTTYQGLMPNSGLSIWVIEKVAGVEYWFPTSTFTPSKLDITQGIYLFCQVSIFIHYQD